MSKSTEDEKCIAISEALKRWAEEDSEDGCNPVKAMKAFENDILDLYNDGVLELSEMERVLISIANKKEKVI